MSIWIKFDFKERKFQQEMALYRYIEIEYKNLTELEKDIESILITKESVKNYLKAYSGF